MDVVLFVISVITAIITVIVAIYGLLAFIDKRVNEKLEHPETLRKISSILNPNLIIDSSGTVLYDKGGWQILENLDVILEGDNERNKGKRKHPEKIIILPKTPMSNAPLVSVIDRWDRRPVATRGEGISWVISFEDDGSSAYVGEDHNPIPPRFKIEFIT
jgi:hypothetical protein